MDVDHPAVPAFAHLGREHLHVAGHDHERDLVLSQDRLDLGFLGGLGGRGDREVVVLGAVPAGDFGMIGVVRDHDRDVDREFAVVPPGEQVVQAVRLLASVGTI